MKASLLGRDVEQPFYFDGVFQHIVAADGDPSGGWADEAGEHADGGGLAGAVGSQEAEGLASEDSKGDSAHCLLAFERL